MFGLTVYQTHIEFLSIITFHLAYIQFTLSV